LALAIADLLVALKTTNSSFPNSLGDGSLTTTTRLEITGRVDEVFVVSFCPDERVGELALVVVLTERGLVNSRESPAD
jgi:hypothetical protein